MAGLPENEKLKQLRAARDRGRQDLLGTLRKTRGKEGGKVTKRKATPEEMRANVQPRPKRPAKPGTPVPKSAPRWNERLPATLALPWASWPRPPLPHAHAPGAPGPAQGTGWCPAAAQAWPHR